MPVFEYRAREGEYIPFRNASPGQQATALLAGHSDTRMTERYTLGHVPAAMRGATTLFETNLAEADEADDGGATRVPVAFSPAAVCNRLSAGALRRRRRAYLCAV